MSRLLSKLIGFNLISRPATLAIAPQGIALQLANQPPKLLTDASFEWADTKQLNEVQQLNHVHQLNKVLAAQSSLLNNLTLNVVLSNSFVRYLVLPWQADVYAQQDWQAIAQHAFRQQYGAIASDWQVTVSLQEFGQNILAAAIDKSLCNLLESSAQQFNFKVRAISPLLMLLHNQQPSALTNWVLVAEPMRLILCQRIKQQWQQVMIDMPPAGQEYQHAMQLVARSLLQVADADQPHKIATYVSASLQKTWRDDIGSRLKLMNATNAPMHHAAWMAGLSA